MLGLILQLAPAHSMEITKAKVANFKFLQLLSKGKFWPAVKNFYQFSCLLGLTWVPKVSK